MIKRRADFPYLPKDFIETQEGLIFAVVSYQPHEGKIGCFLRYVQTDAGWKKVDTAEANQLLSENFPQYHYQSLQFDAKFHAVEPKQIIHHHRPEQRLQALLAAQPTDFIESRLQKLIQILHQFGLSAQYLGVTGSMLIGQQKPGSDIDLAVYGRPVFQQARTIIKQAIQANLLEPLNLDLMKENFERRAGELNFADFSWHESRKFNKAVIDGTKFDIGMVSLPIGLEADHRQFVKQGTETIQARVTEDRYAFDFPARYQVDHPVMSEIVSFTHTYIGQAELGELVEVTGAVECDSATGQCRLVVGSSREALGEYIKVCKE